MAGKNVAAGSVPFFVGCGAYKHHVPASVDHLIQRSEFLTSYTPYQPEIAQGTLQYLFEFQTQVALLTGMEVANASMYDGSTATAEAVLMAHRVTKRNKAVLARQSASALSSRRSRRCRGMAGDAAACAAAVAARRGRGPARDRSTTRRVLRRRADAGRLRPAARPAADRREGACGRRAADRGGHRSRLARPRHAAGRDGRRHRGRARGSRSAMRFEFRRALCRAVRDAAEISCARCRGGSPARRSTPRASAASC